jgi:DNA invertase Pin-like site-specific DNA recombinase
LGWPTSRVLVIDQDLGTSGASTTGRVGFGRLVTEITMGHVGLVGGIEMSRLARSGADWYQLLELCALAGALLADADGIYDPVDDNDRLLLGLGGNNERGRAAPAQTADAGRQAGHGPAGRAGHRAAHRLGAPPLGEAALDPDEQVQTVVRLIVAKFAEPGTLHGVLGWLVDHHVQLGCGCGRGRTPGSWSGGGPTG